PDLPADVRNELRRRGCTVPQVPGEKKPHNVIRGEFIQRGEVDWAILCSVHRASTLLVFRPGAASKCLALASGADIANLQGAGEEKIAYSRAITAVGRAYIDEHYRAYLGTKPPVPIDHQGIDDAFVGKASVVHYFYRGKWLELQGAD
ncbi:MAG: hypothetical protein JO091_07850, partial [Acidobacteriaceae bacterium]|nr:hypothetical protein [Acidobacteriaceae bacterium]